MRDYLTGYLDIIPQGEKRKVEQILKINGAPISSTVSETEFAKLIREISEDHTQQTKVVEQPDRLNSNLFNQFFTNFQIDLNVMFAESSLVDQALQNYDRLYDGILADLSKEIKSLKERIDNLHLVAEGEDGLIMKSFDFRNTTDMETDRASFGYMFVDRDGTPIEDCLIQRSTDVSFLSLGKTRELDKVHDATGKPVAQITLIDYRGTPIAKTTYPIANAIDDSAVSYWGEVVLADDPIMVAMDNIAAGGALVKFSVTLPRPEIINEITLTPFTKYPLEIASITYEEDTETYHTPKELIGSLLENTQTMTLQFPNIIGKRLTFILRQKNYTKDTYLVRSGDINKASLWDKISKREEEVTLSSPWNTDATVSTEELDSYSGWDIYLTELKKYEDAYAKYQAQVNTYNIAHSSYVRQWGG